jgi:hypothetical protein
VAPPHWRRAGERFETHCFSVEPFGPALSHEDAQLQQLTPPWHAVAAGILMKGVFPLHKIIAPIVALGFAFATSAAFAQMEARDFASVDTDMSGSVSWVEFQAAYPDFTEEEFNAADIDGSGELSEDEFELLVSGAPESLVDDSGDAEVPESLVD